jgi:hypothetical protein
VAHVHPDWNGLSPRDACRKNESVITPCERIAHALLSATT